jgi:thiosulfate/3-mercaptopyruvate sulfurtransferase
VFNLLIQPQELLQNLHSGGWLLFDVRHDLLDHDSGRRAYEQGHIPGAIYLDHETDLSAARTGKNGRHPLPARSEFAAHMHLQGLTSRSQVVVYDDGSSMFAAHLWWMLRWLGHEQVAVLDGGWKAWLAAGGPIEAGVNRAAVRESQAVQGISVGGGAAMPTLEVQAMLANLDDPQFMVLDARNASRFKGETEPMDPVAGHIPGAINRPNSLNLQEDGRFKSADALRREYEALLNGVSPAKVVHQCGSGISASHNLFAMELAGLSGSALYHGSWSEWCSDTARPVATG